MTQILRMLINLFQRPQPHDTLYPKSFEDIKQILRQARDNLTSIRVTGGTYPFVPLSGDVIVDLRYLNRLLGLDIYKHTVTVEAGMKLSVLNKILESVCLSLDVYGRVPDLAVCDAIAVGTFGNNGMLSSCLESCEVILSNGKITTWTWERDGREMKSLCCGLGMTAIIHSVTFKCAPLQRYTEISYLCSIRDVLEQWAIQVKASFCQQILWFPFSELTVITHLNPTEKYHMTKQPFINYLFEKVSEVCLRAVRRLGLVASRHNLTLISSILSRIQFFTYWSISKQRSDFIHTLPTPWHSSEACRGSNWLVPINKLPQVICLISHWTMSHPKACMAPLFIQTVKVDRMKLKGRKPFLSHLNEEACCSVWFDWFTPETDPDPILVADFEGIFHSVGGCRAWSGERLTSPLVLNEAYEKYPHWCKMKSILDPNGYLQSAYVHGTVWSESGHSVEFGSTLSLCSSVMDIDH